MKKKLYIAIICILILTCFMHIKNILQKPTNVSVKDKEQAEVTEKENKKKEEDKNSIKTELTNYTIRNIDERDYNRKEELEFGELYYMNNLNDSELILTTTDYIKYIYNLDNKNLVKMDITPMDENNTIYDVISDGDWIVILEFEKNADQGKDNNIVNKGFNWILWAKNTITEEVIVLDKIDYTKEDYNGPNHIRNPFDFHFSNGIFTYSFIDYDINSKKDLSKINYYNFNEKKLYTIDSVDFTEYNLLKTVSTDGKHIAYSENYEFQPSGEFYYKQSDAVIYNIETKTKTTLPLERYVLDTSIHDNQLGLVVQRESKDFIQDVILYDLESATYKELIYENSNIEKHLFNDEIPQYTQYTNISMNDKYIFINVGYMGKSIYFNRKTEEFIDLTNTLEHNTFGQIDSNTKFFGLPIESESLEDNNYYYYELK